MGIFAGGVVFGTLLPEMRLEIGTTTFNSFWIGSVMVVLLTGLYTVLGELSLDGSLTNVAGVLLAALAAASRGSGVICPVGCGGEAAWAGEIEIIAAPSLLSIVNHFKGTQLLPPPEPSLAAAPP